MRRFYAISASFFLLAGLFLGCTRQAPKNKGDENKQALIEQPKVQLDPAVKDKKDDPPIKQDDAKQKEYDAALDKAVMALAERKWPDALTLFEEARSIDDTEYVQSEIARLKVRLAQDGASQATVKDLQTVLNDGKADEAVRLAKDALREFGDGDDAPRLVLLRLQAEALQKVETKEDKDTRFNRFRKEGDDALADRDLPNLRVAAFAFQQALQERDDPGLNQRYDGIRAKLEKYDALRKQAAELRREAARLDDALDALKGAAAAWNTKQVRNEMDECQLAMLKGRETVSVANFELRNDVGMADAGAALADELLPSLKAKYDLVERGQLNRVVGELKLQQGLGEELKQQQHLGKLAKVRYLVVGSIGQRAGVTVLARLVDLQTGLVVQTAKIIAADMDQALVRAPELARQLMMTDDEKMKLDGQVQVAKAAEVVPDNAVVPPAPEAKAPAPLPMPLADLPPPLFANRNADAFNVLAPPQPGFVAPAAEPLVLQQRNRLLFATVQMGDFLFSASRFGEAQRQYEFALMLTPDNLDIQLRLQRVVAFAPPAVVYVRPRVVVLPFMVVGNLSPSLGYWTPANLAPYFSSRYDVVDPAEIYWYMGRMGLTMQDLMVDPNARRWLGRAVGVRYFVLGSCVETTSFDVNTYLLDTELGYTQGAARINVRNSYELKLRLPELAGLTMMTPAEQTAYLTAQQQQQYVQFVSDGRRHMQERRYRTAREEFVRALQMNPDNIQVRISLMLCEQQVPFEELAERRRDQYRDQREAYAADQRRQEQLTEQSERARRSAIAEAAERSEAQRRTHALYRFQARDSMVVQAQIALRTKRFGISVSLFQGATDFAPPPSADVPAPAPIPAVEFAQARLQAEHAEHLRVAEFTAVRETTLRQVREEQLADAQKQLAQERERTKAALDAVQADRAARDEQAYQAGFEQGKKLFTQRKYDAALVAFQGAQRLKQTGPASEMIKQTTERQAEGLGKAQQEKLAAARELREAAAAKAKQNEEQYKLALQTAQQALVAKNYDTAQAKFEEAKRLYKTDAVLTGLQQVQAARADLITAGKNKEAELQFQTLLATAKDALNAKRYPEALKALAGATTLMPNSKEAQDLRRRAEIESAPLMSNDQARTVNYRAALSAGQKALQSKNYDAAITSFQQALKWMPNDPTAVTGLQQAKDAVIPTAKTSTDFQKAMDAGQKAMTAKTYKQAVQAYADATLLNPTDATAKQKFQQAQQALADANQRETLVANYQKAMTVGQKALQSKSYDAAITSFQQALKLMPNDPTAVTGLQQARDAVNLAAKTSTDFQKAMDAGQKAMTAKTFKQAVQAYADATRLNPTDATAKQRLQQAQQALTDANQRETLVANYQKAMTVGQKALQSKSFDAAITSFQQALKLMPNDPTAVTGLQQARNAVNLAAKTSTDFQKAMDAGQKAMTAKTYKQAVQAYADATRLNPTDATAKQRLQQAQQALTDANQGDAIAANYQKAMTAGQAAMATKKYDFAVKYFGDALKLAPNDQNATTQLRAAQKLLDTPKVKTPPPADPAKQYNDAMQCATAAEKDQKHADAVKAYSDALKARPKDAAALAGWKQSQFALNLQQGQQYLDNAMWVAAQNEFQSALNVFPGNPQAQKLLQKAKNKMK
jgi:tetratricopeptide (TPR) repeat protein